MSEINRVALFGKLNSLGYKAIESATVFCKMRGNPYVELVHWFHQVLQLQDSDLHHIISEFDLEPARVAKEMTEALDQLPRGSTSISDLSSHIEDAVERGWVYGTLMFGESQVRTGHLVGLKIAIMGCIVNGPGEMADADFGYVGSGPGRVNLYVGKELVVRNVPDTNADDRLVELIRERDCWVDPT